MSLGRHLSGIQIPNSKNLPFLMFRYSVIFRIGLTSEYFSKPYFFVKFFSLWAKTLSSKDGSYDSVKGYGIRNFIIQYCPLISPTSSGLLMSKHWSYSPNDEIIPPQNPVGRGCAWESRTGGKLLSKLFWMEITMVLTFKSPDLFVEDSS